MKIGTITVAVAGLVSSPLAVASHNASTTLAAGSGGTINTESAVPLEAGSWSFGLRYEEQRSDRLSDGTLLALAEADPDADLHSIESVSTTLLSVGYGLNENLTLGLTLPMIGRQDVRAPHFHEDDAEFEIEREGDAEGLGDLRFYGLWRFRENAQNNMALLFGTSAPTGKDDGTTPDGELYEQEFQPATGSWDPLLGIVYSRRSGRVTLDLSATYNLVGEGSQDTDLGDWLSYNAGVSVLLSESSNLKWRFAVEANGLWRDELTQGGEKEPNSGGHWVNLCPGIIVGRDNWSMFASYGVPVVNEPGGDQDEQDYRFQLGFRIGL
jgi:hypothetical protein